MGTAADRAAELFEDGDFCDAVLSGGASVIERKVAAAIDAAVVAAVAAEREACAKLAETWADPKTPPDSGPGCVASYNEGLGCSAPAGIAAALRARGG